MYEYLPYLISYYDGTKAYSFYLSDYKTPQDMIIACFKSIVIRKYKGYTIYVHNLANFDGIFLTEALVNHYNIKPIINNGRLISLTISSDKYSLKIYDSYQLLLSPLRKLAISFNCSTLKGVFPFAFVNLININLDYNGLVPSHEYYDNFTIEEYNNYTLDYNNKTWNLKREAIYYCELDCISLYQVIEKFNFMIYKQFRLNITKYPTITSLTFAIFRSGYLKEDQIPMLSGQIFNDISVSYTGGSTDMYIPSNVQVDNNSLLPLSNGEPLYCYDVNSLYPSVMLNSSLPCGQINYFEGDILKYKPDACGFFYCKVTSPEFLEHPILQLHHKKSTMSPLGS